MIWHPLTLAIAATDFLALLFFARAGWTAVRTLADWSDEASTREQIRLETAYEIGAISARLVFALVLLSTLLLVVAVTIVFPALVPGAMCGTGVLQATSGAGGRAFLFRLPAVGLLYLWSVMEALNRSRPDFPLARQNSRFLLLAVPFIILAAYETFGALGHLNVHNPVDCCTAVYDRVAGTGKVGRPEWVGGPILVGLFGAATLLLVALGVSGLASPRRYLGFISAAAALIAFAWGPLSAVVLVRVLAAYTYEVLYHHCPWCLFLPEHGAVGFPLFLFLGIAVIQAAAAFAAFRVTTGIPGLAAAGEQQSRRALALMVLFALLFTATATWPALSWRLRYGVWMG